MNRFYLKQAMSPKKPLVQQRRIYNQLTPARIIRRRTAFNRIFTPILKTFQGIYKSSVKADPNRIIFSSVVFGTS